MITHDQAERIAAGIVGAPTDDAGRGWELKEFGAGWLIIEHAAEGRRGGATRVVERATGRVMRFPSFVPPARIIDEYDQVAGDGYPENPNPSA